MDIFNQPDDGPGAQYRLPPARPPRLRPFIALAAVLVAIWVVLELLPPPKHHAILNMHNFSIEPAPDAPAATHP